MRDLHLETRYQYSLLDEQEKALYLRMLDCFFGRATRFRLIPEEIGVDIYKVFEAIRCDFPELFAVSYADIVLTVPEEEEDPYGPIIWEYALVNGTVYTEEEYNELEKRLDDFLHLFDGIDDPFELEVAVYDYVIEHFAYASHALPRLDEIDRGTAEPTERADMEVFTVAGPLKTGYGVCAAYTRLVQFVLQQHGVPAAYISAPSMGEEGEANTLIYHAWLAVKLDGEYYHLDVTFDDTDGDDEGNFPYSHFNITDDEVDDDHIISDMEKAYPGIVCRATTYNYYHRRGLYFETADEVALAAFRFANDWDGVTEERIFYCRFTPGITEDEIRARIQAHYHNCKAKWMNTATNEECGWIGVSMGYTPRPKNTEE